MNNLYHGFEFIRAYIDELFVLTKGYQTDHENKLLLALNKMKEKDLNVILKCLSLKNEMEYLGFWVTHDFVKLIDKKYNQ